MSGKSSKAGGAAKRSAAVPTGKKVKESLLFPSQPKNLRVGGAVRPRNRDLTRFVKWPRNVRIQRQRKVLYQRLKTPPAINVFRAPLDKAEALPLFALMAKYRPELASAKKERLSQQAERKAAGGVSHSPALASALKFGLNHITYLVEQKKARLVVIASDVEPIELVVWLPALCRRFGVPYAIVNNKGRLGALVHQKSATAVALTSLKTEDEAAFARVVEVANARFKDNTDSRRKWGGGIMGLKTQRRLEKREKLIQAELAKKAML